MYCRRLTCDIDVIIDVIIDVSADNDGDNAVIVMSEEKTGHFFALL